MTYYHRLGEIPPKRHTQFRQPDGSLYAEELVSSRGFSGIYSNLYHIHPPTRVEKVGPGYKVRRDGKVGLINANADPLLDFKFDGIEEWNDTSFLVINEGARAIVTLQEDTLMHNITQLELLVDRDQERIFKFVQNGRFGLLSDREGVLLNPEYTDIFNVGPQDNPLFFADQHLSNAGFHVVSYVDDQGELVFAKAYNKQEFDRILCDDY